MGLQAWHLLHNECRLYKAANINPEALQEVSLPVFQPPPQQHLRLSFTNIQNTEVLRSTVRVTAIRLVSLDASTSPGKLLAWNN